MYPTLAQEILYDHGIAYALTDAQLDIVYHSDNLKHDSYDTLLGVSLLTVAPEMRSDRLSCSALLDGTADRWELPCVLRRDGNGLLKTFYLRVTRTRAPQPPLGFLYVEHDLTVVSIAPQQPSDSLDDFYLFRQNAARDLRASLTPLNGYLEMLADEEFGALSLEQIQVVATLRQNVQRLEKLGDNWLDPTRAP